jgi:hypothetical protein
VHNAGLLMTPIFSENDELVYTYGCIVYWKHLAL